MDYEQIVRNDVTKLRSFIDQVWRAATKGDAGPDEHTADILIMNYLESTRPISPGEVLASTGVNIHYFAGENAEKVPVHLVKAAADLLIAAAKEVNGAGFR